VKFDKSRRRFIGTVATLTAVGLAGCGGDGDDGDDTPTDTETDAPGTDTQTDDSNMTDTETESRGYQEGIDSYLSDNGNNYDGTVEDMTGNDTVTVEVGVGDQGYAYGPAAVQIDVGTTVEFNWTGRGQAHNVKPADGSDFPDLDSGDQVQAEGVEYTYTFEESGLATYYCTPHQSLGMLGAIGVL
jgi:halocyanin-like protein